MCTTPCSLTSQSARHPSQHRPFAASNRGGASGAWRRQRALGSARQEQRGTPVAAPQTRRHLLRRSKRSCDSSWRQVAARPDVSVSSGTRGLTVRLRHLASTARPRMSSGGHRHGAQPRGQLRSVSDARRSSDICSPSPTTAEHITSRTTAPAAHLGNVGHAPSWLRIMASVQDTLVAR